MAGAISAVDAELSNVQSSDQTGSWRAWAVVLSASLFFFYEFGIMNIFNSLNAALVSEFHISEAQLGNLSAFYFYANILFLFPAGIIVDRVSTRKLILVAMTSCVVSTFLFAHASSLLLAMLCRFCMGVGGAFVLLSPVRLASRWFPAQKMAFVVGVIVTIAFVGGMLAQYTLRPIEIYGWRHVMSFIGFLGVAMIAAIYFFVKDFPDDYDNLHPDGDHAHHTTMPFLESIKLAAKNIQNWLAGTYTSLLNLPVFVLGAFLGSLYLEQVHHLSSMDASYVSSMIYFGTIFGSPTIGWLSDRIGLRKLPMLFFGVLSLIVMLMIMLVTTWSYSSLLVLFFLLGFFTSAQIISYPLIAESNPSSITATATSIGSTIIMFGGLSQPFTGWLLDLHWDKTMLHGSPFYTYGNFTFALSILPIAFVFGLLAALFIRETRCMAKD